MEEAIFGSAGCGKTTEVVRILRETTKATIACSFTRAAAEEIERRIQQSNVISSTIHSLCYKFLGLNRRQIISQSDIDRIATKARVTAEAVPDFVQLYYLANSARRGYEEVFQDAEQGTLDEFVRFCVTFDRYKDQFGVSDFNDMLSATLNSKDKMRCDLLVVDEAQDLSPLQWDVVDRIVANRKIFAGDDWQSIYGFSGADPTRLLSIENYRVLGTTYRLHQEIVDLAAFVTSKIGCQRKKEIVSAKGKGGTVERVRPEDIVATDKEEILFLYRSKSEIQEVVELCWKLKIPVEGPRLIGSPVWKAILLYDKIRQAAGPLLLNRVEQQLAAMYFADADVDSLCKVLPWWAGMQLGYEERDYFRTIVERHGLGVRPRACARTIHGAKGMEANRVILNTGINDRIARQMGDAEYRVWYVAVTRAKQTLTLVESQGQSLI